jgi:hypothetical protein
MTETRFKLRTFGFDTMLNYHLLQKLKLIGRDKFNYLINTIYKKKINQYFNTRILFLLKKNIHTRSTWKLAPSHGKLNA